MAGNVKLMTSAGGGVVLDTATTTATDVTVKVPTQNCTLGIQGPAFSAYLTASQSVSNNTLTKISFNAELFDTANCFDKDTNYRFQPNVAGYYQFNGIMTANGTTLIAAGIYLYKNGSAYQRLGYQLTAGPIVSGSTIIYLNGTTDYVELYGIVSASSGNQFYTDNSSLYTSFSGGLVRAA